MSNKKNFKIVGILILFSLLFLTTDSLTKEIPYELINLENISRYDEDRIAFQHIQLNAPEYTLTTKDNSITNLLIIANRKMYLMKDGYDNPEFARSRRIIIELENKLFKNDDLWINKIDSKADFLRIFDRRIEILKKIDSAADEKVETKKGDKPGSGSPVKAEKDFVAKNFQKLYTNVRNEFLKKHVSIFKKLMIDRKKSGLHVERKPLPKPFYVGAKNVPAKYSIRASVKTIDEKFYYAEDADGDGITETFTVNIPDGFNWGYKSGPNIIFIYNNREKDLEEIIGSLTSDAYHGTDEEAQAIKESMKSTFPKEDDPKNVKKWIDKMVPTVD
jgi:hypothetical protein